MSQEDEGMTEVGKRRTPGMEGSSSVSLDCPTTGPRKVLTGGGLRTYCRGNHARSQTRVTGGTPHVRPVEVLASTSESTMAWVLS